LGDRRRGGTDQTLLKRMYTKGMRPMKRNTDLIRRILLDLEERGSYTNWLDVDIEEYSPEQMDYHLELLVEAGLIRTRASGQEPTRQYPVRLTWEGHEFLDAARDETRWQRAKESTARAGGVPFQILKAVLLEMVEQEAR
jgi:DNA-binding HxlR family transcriptional regulator